MAIGFEGSFTFGSQGHSGGLAVLWRNKEEVELKTFSTHHIDMIITVPEWPQFRLTGVYGEPNRSKRKLTWKLISDLAKLSNLPWCLIGDMNNVTCQSDKRGGRPYPTWLIEGFQSVLTSCGLIDMEMEGYKFTWERGKGTDNWIEVKLDRAFVTSSWFDKFPNARLTNLEVSTSDHCPILLSPAVQVHKPPSRSFKFENAWLREPMCRKIKLLKGRRDTDSAKRYKEENEKLAEILTQKEIFWRQRSKQLWLKEGDHNSKYFHAAAKTRKRNNQINSLRNDSGNMVGWDDGIQEVMEGYFQQLFTPTVTSWNQVIDCIPTTITPVQNMHISAPVEESEVKKALFQMHPDKSSGPDGMSPGFYQKFWDVLRHDVVQLVKDFFQNATFPDQLPATNIVLVPKKKQPTSMTEIRPISLCNVLYKVISKVLANRIKSVLNLVISETQSAFIPNRLITNNIMVAFEIMHYMKRKTAGRNGVMALKLDMSKAYDRVEWGYLQAVLIKMGVDNHTTSLLMSCVTSATYQIAHAGRLFGSITPGRGLRQGDPLSSYLFIICTEGFSALLKHYEQRQQLRGIQIARGAPTVSHMFFADDSYIFCRANEREASNVQTLLNVFEQASGQKINAEKSSIFFSRNTAVHVRDTICGDMGIHEADDHGTYLGLPNIIGRKKSAILGFLKEKVQKCIQSWDGKLLSKAGKEILLKTIVQALPNYAMSVFLLPIETSKEMERAMCKYWWSSSSKKDKNIHWMSWERMCKPKSQGGLGFRNLYDFNVALLGKQGWRLIVQPHSLVSRVFKAKYYPNGTFLSAELGGSPSFVWRSIMEAQLLLKKGAAIRVGSGASVNILNDPWLPDNSDPFVHTVSKSLIDKKVYQLMSIDQDQWDMDILNDIFNERDINLIVSIPIQITEPDIWYWKKENLGHYSVKSAYAIIQEGKQQSATPVLTGYWRKCWNLKVPPKVKNFLWQASTSCLPTKTQLQTKHVAVNALCPFCNVENETISHILVTCSFSKACWTELEPAITTVVVDTFPSWLNLIFENWSGRSRQLVVMLCWALWKCRNDLVWNQKSAEVKDVVMLAQTVLNQWLYAQDKNFDPSLGLLYPEDGNEHWTPPNVDTIKINTDAAIFSSTNRYSYSCVARSHLGILLEAKAKCVRGVVSPEVAEAIGIHEALSWIKDKQWSRVVIESDCLVAIQSIRSSSTMSSYFGRIINKCKSLLDDLKDCFVSLRFVKRSANNGAHYLARSTCFIADRSLSVSTAPSEFISVLMNDLI
ncbi:uncharacterized protein LOC133038159 [Cannabis sativa]|uniref:uncharacterized protein LOC133038159 n=1 Tax=Cannabis sativa TaxID=3483 RepID=UPI0029CA30E1|nr:uncharacterized protein LOC133038159 [Cannabis sativa]